MSKKPWVFSWGVGKTCNVRVCFFDVWLVAWWAKELVMGRCKSVSIRRPQLHTGHLFHIIRTCFSLMLSLINQTLNVFRQQWKYLNQAQPKIVNHVWWAFLTRAHQVIVSLRSNLQSAWRNFFTRFTQHSCQHWMAHGSDIGHTQQFVGSSYLRVTNNRNVIKLLRKLNVISNSHEW